MIFQTLTLEEKQRLAQEQEQQRRFKEQKPLTVSTSKTSSTGNVARSQPKDLTASLMSASTVGSPGMMGNQGMLGQNSLNSNVMQFSHSASNTGGFPNYSGGGTLGQTSGIRPTATTNTKHSFDLSGFDSLLPNSSQQKMSMNHVQGIQSQGSSHSTSNSSFNSMNNMMNQPIRPQTLSGLSRMPGQQGMMGTTGFMGQQGMMGGPGMMGNQGFMGQQNMARQPMMPTQLNMPMSSMNFSQSQGSSNIQNSNITSNDISDIFG